MQYHSNVYGALITAERREVALALTVTPYWRTGIKYVSPYLEGDDFGQFYMEVIGLNIPF